MTDQMLDLARRRAAVASMSRLAQRNPLNELIKTKLRRLQAEYAEAKLLAVVRRIVDGAPPLAPDLGDRIAVVLHAENETSETGNR